MQPAIVLDLGLQLAGRPAGITERENGALRSLSARNRLEDVEGRGQADPFVDGQGRVLDKEVARMQHEADLRIERPGLEHRNAARAPRRPDMSRGRAAR